MPMMDFFLLERGGEAMEYGLGGLLVLILIVVLIVVLIKRV